MIENLELKLSGELPVTRIELFELVNSWGRSDIVITDDNIRIPKCNPKECYPLENLNVSQIIDLSFIFSESFYNGDLSEWNVGNCRDFKGIFSYSKFNNDSIKDWNTSKVTNMDLLFYKSKFSGDISSWNLSAITFSDFFVFLNHNFENKYNDGKSIPKETKNFLEWFEKNREKMREINTPKEKVLDFFSFDSNDIKKDIN